MQLTPLAKTKRSSSGKSFPPLGPDTKVFVVWVERFDDIGRDVESLDSNQISIIMKIGK